MGLLRQPAVWRKLCYILVAVIFLCARFLSSSLNRSVSGYGLLVIILFNFLPGFRRRLVLKFGHNMWIHPERQTFIVIAYLVSFFY